MNYLARPCALNNNREKNFDNIKDALKYLEESTGYRLGAEDWKEIGKLMEVENGISVI